MYHEELLSVSSISNGFLVRFRKHMKEEDVKESCPCVSSYDERERTAFFKSESDVASAIEAMLPKLIESSPKDDFDSTFEEIVK